MTESNTSTYRLQARGNSNVRPDLSIVIVSWNVRDLLTRCLHTLISGEVQGSLSIETIVVDNASSDSSADAARHFPNVQVIENHHNAGYGRANNQGLKVANGKHLLVLNPDTIPQPGSLEALMRFAEAHPCAGIVSPRLLNPDGSVQPNAFRFPTLLQVALDLFPPPPIVPGRIRHRLTQSRLNGRYPDEENRTRPFRIDHPLGACMLLNRAAYEQMGGFDPALFMYSEEIDLALRYARADWECWQVPAAQVVHLGGQSTRQLPYRMYVELWRSRLYVYRKHYAYPSRVALAAMLTAAQFLDLASTTVKRTLKQMTPKEARQRQARARAVVRLVFAR